MLWTRLFCNWEHTLTKQEHINMCIKYLKGAKRMGLESWWCLAKDIEEQEETEHWKFPLNMQKVIFIFRMTQHWRYSKPTWIQSCTVCLRWTCCTTGFGLECLHRFNSKHSVILCDLIMVLKSLQEVEIFEKTFILLMRDNKEEIIY